MIVEWSGTYADSRLTINDSTPTREVDHPLIIILILVAGFAMALRKKPGRERGTAKAERTGPDRPTIYRPEPAARRSESAVSWKHSGSRLHPRHRPSGAERVSPRGPSFPAVSASSTLTTVPPPLPAPIGKASRAASSNRTACLSATIARSRPLKSTTWRAATDVSAERSAPALGHAR